jgi:hypothetical protein
MALIRQITDGHHDLVVMARAAEAPSAPRVAPAPPSYHGSR